MSYTIGIVSMCSCIKKCKLIDVGHNQTTKIVVLKILYLKKFLSSLQLATSVIIGFRAEITVYLESGGRKLS